MSDKPGMISRADATSLPPYDSDGDPAGQFDHHIFVKLSDLRALPAAQVAVKPLEWTEEKTLGVGCIRLVADSILGKFSIEYGGWANGKLCLGVPWRDESVWLENDPDAAKTYANRLLSDRIRSALPVALAQVADPAQIRARVSGLGVLPRFSGYDIMMGQDGFDPQPTPDGVWVRFADVTALIDTPPAVSDEVAALVDAATALADWAEQGRACGDWGNWDWSECDEYSRTRAALAKMKGGA